jgi:uncharacterized SAM-binding protein YcdF (DUF218 family)
LHAVADAHGTTTKPAADEDDQELAMLRSVVSDPVFLTLLVGGSGLLVGVWRRRLGALIVFTAFVALYALSTAYIATRLLAAVEPDPSLAADARELRPKAIVVLAGGVRSAAPPQDESINEETLDRVRHAARLWRETHLPVLVSGGVMAGTRQSAAAMMAATLHQDFAVPVAWQEERSRSTYENAKYSAQMLETAGIRTIYIVTHAWHMARAVDIFERWGFEVVPAPTGFTQREPASGPGSFLPRAYYLAGSGRALRELVGGAVYRLIYAPQPPAGSDAPSPPSPAGDQKPLTTSGR